MPYGAAGVIAIIVTSIVNHDVFLNIDINSEKSASQKMYRKYLYCIMLYYVTDVLWGIFYDIGITGLVLFDTTVYFVALAASVVLWTRYVVSYLEEKNRFGKMLTLAGWVIFFYVIVMLIINFRKPVFFSLTEGGEYSTGIARHITMGLLIALFFMTGAYDLLIAGKSSGSVRFSHFTIGVSSLAMAGFVIAQIYLPLFPMYAIGAMLASCIQHSFVIEKERELYHSRLEQEESENTRLEKELKSQSELTELMSSMSSLLVNMPAMTFSKDLETGRYMACNQAFAEYAGKNKPEEVVGLTDHQIFDKDTADKFVEDDKRTAEMDKPNVFFEDVPDATESIIRNLQTTKQTFNDAAGRLCLLGLCVDVTETAKIKAEQAASAAREQEIQKKQELEKNYKKHVEELSYRASHDELTGIYNRLGYDHILPQIDLSQAFFILLDADDFKSVNDTYGHETGDRALIRITDALKNNFRTDDFIFRIGGDEFIVIMNHVSEEMKSLAAAKVENINRELAEEKDGVPAVSLCAGIVHGSGTREDEDLFSRADMAMYEAKQNGKHSFRFA